MGSSTDASASERPDGSTARYADRRRALRECLTRLDLLDTTAELRADAPRELARSCGFTRAMISAVRGSRWMPLELHTREDLDPTAAAFRSYVEDGADIPLANLLAETDMVRRRTAVLVPEALIPRRAFAPIIEVARSPGYVAAPVVVEGRAVGFVHADRVGQPGTVDEQDRRLVAAFAAELGVLHQRAWWSERLAERGWRARAELERAVVDLRRIESQPAEMPTTSTTPVTRVSQESRATSRRPESVLTAREWDVLAHVSDGATNRVVAHRLSLAEHTVKTHLRNVLRKLGASSRAAAVAWYLETGRGVR